jgi:hypothetical protein
MPDRAASIAASAKDGACSQCCASVKGHSRKTSDGHKKLVLLLRRELAADELIDDNITQDQLVRVLGDERDGGRFAGEEIDE